MRDISLQDGPPLALVEPRYLPAVFLSTFVVAVCASRIARLNRLSLGSDSVAIGVFAVAGTLRSLDVGLGPWPTVLLGTITAVGGGLMIDMIVGQTPRIFLKGELIAFAAGMPSIAVLLCHEIGTPPGLTILVGIVVGTSVRWRWTSWAPSRVN